MCFRERDGQFLWQYTSPRLGEHSQDCSWHSMGTPLVEGDRLWLITNRCESLCFDIGPLRRGAGPGDGWLRAFDAGTGTPDWRCDFNPKGATFDFGGRGRRNYVMATPIAYDGRDYLGTGASPEYGFGEGDLLCVDPGGTGDVSADLEDGPGKVRSNPNSRVVWRFSGRPHSTATACTRPPTPVTWSAWRPTTAASCGGGTTPPTSAAARRTGATETTRSSTASG